MSMETLIRLMELLAKAISNGQQAWLYLWILECPGSCASNQMLLIPLWVICSFVFVTWDSKWCLLCFICNTHFSITYRSTPAMASTVINSPQIPTTNPKCGPRIGVDGMVSDSLILMILCMVELPLLLDWLFISCMKLVTNVVSYNL